MLLSPPRCLNARAIALTLLLLVPVELPGAALAAERPASAEAAAPVRGKAVPGDLAAPGLGHPVSWAKSEPAAHGCSRSRRKLWQEGEGWVVKAVKSCP